MLLKQIRTIIETDKKIDVEFKEARDTISKNIYKSVCSFNNRDGGHLLLGVNDQKEIIGVDPTKADKMIKKFTTTINNPEKFVPTLYLTPEKIIIVGKTIIYIKIPKGSDVCRLNGRFYDRSHDGDIDITNNTDLLYKMISRKKHSNFVDKVYPHITLNDLNSSVIEKARKMALSQNKHHPWKNLNDEELLRSAGLIKNDQETGEEGITLAGILLFGKDHIISSILPHYKTDAIAKIENKDRYDDRDVIITNLIDSYDRLMAFGKKQLKDLFVLDDIYNVSARDYILREIISNTLAHRDYSSRFVSRIIIDDEKILVENSDTSSRMGQLILGKSRPLAKNPTISKVFREIGLAEELGSGIRNTYKYTRLYSGADPVFEEGDIFTTTIPLKKIATLKVGGRTKTTNKNKENLKEFIKDKIKNNNKITRKEIADDAGVSIKTIERHIKEIDNLEYFGSGDKGFWILKE